MSTPSPLRISSSELRSYQRCRRRWYIQYVLGYGTRRDPGDVGVSRVGTLYHAGIEAYYKGLEPPQAVDTVEALVKANVEELVAAGKEHRVKAVESNGELVRIMLEGHFEWLGDSGIDEDLDVTSAEEALEVELPEMPGVVLIAKTDMRAVRRSNGKRVVMDSKTVQSAADQQTIAPMSSQFKHYLMIETLLGKQPADGLLVRWARRVKRTAKATPPFYGEISVEHSREVLRAYYRQTVQLIGEMQHVREELAYDERTRSEALLNLYPALAGGPRLVEQELCGPTVDRSCGYCPFRPICPVLDDVTLDVTQALEWSYEKVDPLARYADDRAGEDEE